MGGCQLGCESGEVGNLMSRSYRIAVGSILTESNEWVARATELEDFERTEFRRGIEILEGSTGVVGGMLRVLRQRNVEVLPLISASACPGGLLSSHCYRHLRREFLEALRRFAAPDAVLLGLHGAASAVDLQDPEGDLLEATRELVGWEVPVVATLDLHAHVTGKMVRCADALVAWETYPHRDSVETGSRGARLLLDMLDGKVKPTMAMAKVPVLTGAVNASTDGDTPFADLMRLAKSWEAQDGVLSTSVFLVDPYLDCTDMGSGGLVVTDGDREKAIDLAREVAEAYWERRFDLVPSMYQPAEAVSEGMRIEGAPVLLVETADTCGGGASGDSVASLKALLQAQVNELCLVPVVDPEAAARCHQAGQGKEIRVELGHKLDPQWGQPIAVKGLVGKLSNGRFRYSGGIWGGQWGDMGPSAMLQIGKVQVLIASHPTYEWADEQFRSMEMNASAAKFIVVKNPMNYRNTYLKTAKKAFILDTPGPTPAILDHMQFRRLKRPYFPADKDIPNLTPTILS